MAQGSSFARIKWVKARCLSDITTPKNFFAAYKQIKNNLNFAIRERTSEIGASYWMAIAIKRLMIITNLRKKALIKEALDCLSLGNFSLKYSTDNNYGLKLVNLFELAKTALILKDNYLFEKYIDMMFNCVSKLPEREKYLEIIAWDVLIRGYINFGNFYKAAETIKKVKIIQNKKYRALNLFFKNTCHHFFISIKDPVYDNWAQKLKNEIWLEACLLNNPYQKLRFKRKKYIGL